MCGLAGIGGRVRIRRRVISVAVVIGGRIRIGRWMIFAAAMISVVVMVLVSMMVSVTMVRMQMIYFGTTWRLAARPVARMTLCSWQMLAAQTLAVLGFS